MNRSGPPVSATASRRSRSELSSDPMSSFTTRSAVIAAVLASALALARDVDAQQAPDTGSLRPTIVRFDGGEASPRAAQRRRFVSRHLALFRACGEDTAQTLGLPRRALHGVEARVVMPFAAHEGTSPSATVTVASAPSAAHDALRQCFERAARAITMDALARPTTVRFAVRLQFTTQPLLPHVPPGGTGGVGAVAPAP